MQVRVPFLAALAALASAPALALAQPMTSAQAGGDCFRRVPADPANVWVAAPCQGQVAPSAFPDGLAGGPPPPLPSPPAPPLSYQADAGAGYAQTHGAPPTSYPAPGYSGPAYSGPTYAGAGYASPGYWPQPDDAAPAYVPPPQPVYAPNRAPYYAGNIGNAPGPIPLPAAPPPPLYSTSVYAAPPAADPAPAYAQLPPRPDYGPPPLTDYGYGPGDCALTSGALSGGGFWQRQDCRPAVAPPPAPPYPAQAYGYGYGASSGAYSQQQGGGYQVSEGGYAYAANDPAGPPAYAPGQCASSAGLIAGGRASYEAQSCERSSSQSYSYASGSGGYYGGGGGFQGDGPRWGVAGRDPNGFLTWPGKVGY